MLDEVEKLIRKSLSEEEEAISNYLERKQILICLLDETNDEDEQKIQTYINVLDDIISEEQIHVGQLRQLLTVFEIPSDNETKGKEETVSSYADVLAEMESLIKED